MRHSRAGKALLSEDPAFAVDVAAVRRRDRR